MKFFHLNCSCLNLPIPCCVFSIRNRLALLENANQRLFPRRLSKPLVTISAISTPTRASNAISTPSTSPTRRHRRRRPCRQPNRRSRRRNATRTNRLLRIVRRKRNRRRSIVRRREGRNTTKYAAAAFARRAVRVGRDRRQCRLGRRLSKRYLVNSVMSKCLFPITLVILRYTRDQSPWVLKDRPGE